MKKWSCEIERASNGFILRNTSEHNDDDSESKSVFVFKDAEDKDEFEEQLHPLKDVFFAIMDFFGIYNSKHEKIALDISIVGREDFPCEETIKELKEKLENL